MLLALQHTLWKSMAFQWYQVYGLYIYITSCSY